MYVSFSYAPISINFELRRGYNGFHVFCQSKPPLFLFLTIALWPKEKFFNQTLAYCIWSGIVDENCYNHVIKRDLNKQE